MLKPSEPEPLSEVIARCVQVPQLPLALVKTRSTSNDRLAVQSFGSPCDAEARLAVVDLSGVAPCQPEPRGKVRRYRALRIRLRQCRDVVGSRDR